MPLAELAALLPRVEGVAVELVSFPKVLDSSAIVPADWLEMASLCRQLSQDVDGLVLVHGTDTLAFTSSALSFLLHDLPTPVVITGSQVPLSFDNNDAAKNYVDAVADAGSGQSGVRIVFGGRQVLGCRARKLSSERWQAFGAPKLADEAPLVGTAEPSPLQMLGQDLNAIEPRVGLLYLHPGLSQAEIAAQIARTDQRALVIAAYGVGNMLVDAQVIEAVETAMANDKLLVLVSQCAHGSTQPGLYASSRGLPSGSIIDGADMTIEAALTKLMVLLGNLPEAKAREMMALNCAGELSAQATA